MAESLDERVHRYIDGDLSAPEQRQLAQAALDDPALFETLTAAALLKQTAREEAEPASLAPTISPIRRPSRTRLALFVGGALAAAAVLALMVVPRSSSTTNAPDSLDAERRGGSAPSESRSAAANIHATILTARLTEPDGAATPEFRSLEPGSRLPKISGRVTSNADGEIEVDLGSLDGIAKGSIVQIVGGPAPSRAIGTLTITTVFRERSRGKVATGSSPRIGDRADVAPDVHVAAVSEQVAARVASGDTQSARALAAEAAGIVESLGLVSGAGRLALYQAAVLDQASGSADQAVRYLRLAAAQFDAAPAATGDERARILSALGAALIAKDNDAEAERTLRLAQPIATGRVGVHVANNLAALAARRGDRAAAGSLYRSALAQAGNAPGLEAERRTIQTNLDALASSH
ncbi:MAG TPA: hypothetical protein VH436_20535 [Vicinamibacterales bacterium]